MSINIQIEKKHLWLLVSVMVFLLAVGYVIAFNSGASPSIMGHSAEELEGVCKTDGTGCPSLGSGLQSRVTGICGEGSSIRTINADGSVVCEIDDTGSSGTDTRCDTSGRCTQVCVGSTCRTSWPNQGLDTHPISCTNTCTAGSCNCITSSCVSGFALTSWSCSWGDEVMSATRGECTTASRGRATGSGTCTRIDPL